MNAKTCLQSNVSKICNFYAGQNHFITTVVPYIIENLRKKNQVLCFVEKDVKNELYKQIKNSFGENNADLIKYFRTYSYQNVQNTKDLYYFLTPFFEKNKNDKILICIQENVFIGNFFSEVVEKLCAEKSISAKILNCFEFKFGRFIIEKIFSLHSHILNTQGIFPIEKIFNKAASA